MRLSSGQQAALGLVQGVAEVLPVSSSAQLTLLPWLLGWPVVGDATTFAAGLHGGSSFGIALALRQDLADLDRAGWTRLALSAVPAAMAGVVGQAAVERRLGRPGPTAALLASAGALLWLADRRRETTALTGRQTAVAAVAQVVALAPGVSRSGATLTALRFAGVSRESSARQSLLMSLPVTAGAAVLTSVRSRSVPALVPSAVAAVAAFATTRAAERASFRVTTAAALYRLGVAAAAGVRLRSSREST